MSSSSPSHIVGAGLAGLIAAHAWPNATILEAAQRPGAMHRALLRFRSDAVARLTGIEFRKVRVRKGIWYDDAYREPSIALANMYAQKCTGQLLADRSIWNLDPADRYVAPDNFYDQLLANVGPRVMWGQPVQFIDMVNRASPVVTTAPLPEVLKQLNVQHTLTFTRQPIHVMRFHVPNCDVYQTVYFPCPNTALYRASITGNMLICEFAGDEPDGTDEWDRMVEAAFGLLVNVNGMTAAESVSQKYGKIAPVEDNQRRRLLFDLTHNHNLYSLGRFATWRNLLLDDVVTDIDVVKRLMRMGSYDLSRASTALV